MDHFHPEELLFEIPVYRTSFDAYHDELRRTMDETEVKLQQESSPWKDLPPEEIRREAERWTHMRYGRPYWYNEMIGVVRIYQDGGSIKGQFWSQPQRAFRRNFRKYDFSPSGRVLEYHAPPGHLTSLDVYTEIRDDLGRLTRRGGPLDGRHMDLYAFEKVGPHVDWLAILGWPQPG